MKRPGISQVNTGRGSIAQNAGIGTGRAKVRDGNTAKWRYKLRVPRGRTGEVIAIASGFPGVTVWVIGMSQVLCRRLSKRLPICWTPRSRAKDNYCVARWPRDSFKARLAPTHSRLAGVIHSRGTGTESGSETSSSGRMPRGPESGDEFEPPPRAGPRRPSSNPDA
jgi:hypothetical protein